MLNKPNSLSTIIAAWVVVAVGTAALTAWIGRSVANPAENQSGAMEERAVEAD